MKLTDIRQQLDNFVERGIVPGISYATVLNGEVETKIFGKAQLVPESEPLKYGMQYDVASLTKVVGTTNVILKLIEAKKLNLDDSIQQYIPQFNNQRVTIRHLLTHTSAISGYIPHRNELPPKQLLDALDNLPVADWFDQKVVYTDVGLIMLGQIIEKIYQQPVQKVIQDEILTPLNLLESTFNPIKENAVPTEISPNRGLIRGEVHDPKAFILREHCGSAGLFMTLNDLLKFAQWILYPHGKLVVSDQMIDSLFQDWTTHHLGRSLGWDLKIAQNGEKWIYHTGFTGTFILLNRKYKSGLILLTNRVHPSADNQPFLDLRDEIVEQFINNDCVYKS